MKFYVFITLLLFAISRVQSFSNPSLHFATRTYSSAWKSNNNVSNTSFHLKKATPIVENRSTHLHLNANGDESSGDVITLPESGETVVGVTGLVMSVIMLYSEYVLKMTGSGVPEGPYGLFGAAEGLSYLGVVGLVAFSLYTKVKTVRSIYYHMTHMA